MNKQFLISLLQDLDSLLEVARNIASADGVSDQNYKWYSRQHDLWYQFRDKIQRQLVKEEGINNERK